MTTTKEKMLNRIYKNFPILIYCYRYTYAMLEHCLLLIILFMFAVRQHFSAMIHASDQYNNLYSSICYKNNTSLCYPIIKC